MTAGPPDFPPPPFPPPNAGPPPDASAGPDLGRWFQISPLQYNVIPMMDPDRGVKFICLYFEHPTGKSGYSLAVKDARDVAARLVACADAMEPPHGGLVVPSLDPRQLGDLRNGGQGRPPR